MSGQSDWRNSSEFVEWLNRYNRLNHADLTSKTAPEYLLVEFVEMTTNAKLREEVKDLFTRNQTLVSENDRLQAKAQNQRDENANLRKVMRANEKRAIDARVELNDDVRKERAHVAKLQSENAKLREQLAEAVSLLESIGYFADIQVTDARDDILEGGTPDDNAERWERIATFLFRRGFYDTTTQEMTR